jgi:hypothetical protein
MFCSFDCVMACGVADLLVATTTALQTRLICYVLGLGCNDFVWRHVVYCVWILTDATSTKQHRTISIFEFVQTPRSP